MWGAAIWSFWLNEWEVIVLSVIGQIDVSIFPVGQAEGGMISVGKAEGTVVKTGDIGVEVIEG